MDNNNFFAYISRLSLITRWSLMRNCRNENDAEHSMFTACVAHALGVIANNVFNKNIDSDKLAVYALYHDAHEVLTGDMPTPIKHNNPSINDAYKAVESKANDKLLETLPVEMRNDYAEVLNYDPLSYEAKLIKASDTISAYVKCIEECSMGNGDFKNALEATEKRLREMRLDEVDWFLDSFRDSFGKTVDAL